MGVCLVLIQRATTTKGNEQFVTAIIIAQKLLIVCCNNTYISGYIPDFYWFPKSIYHRDIFL